MATKKLCGATEIALANGRLIYLRGPIPRGWDGRIEIPVESGRTIESRLPSYRMPQVRKHASGYYVAPGMDVLDLFIGSEGTLGVIVEAEVKLLPKPEGLLSGVVFFASNESLLAFVADARAASLKMGEHGQPVGIAAQNLRQSSSIDARALEYFDSESLSFLKQKYDTVPAASVGAVFFEQETTSESEDLLMTEWLALMERHQALADESWFATAEQDQEKLREFRHQLPVLMNEWFARYKQRKVSTDMAVPDEEFAA